MASTGAAGGGDRGGAAEAYVHAPTRYHRSVSGGAYRDHLEAERLEADLVAYEGDLEALAVRAPDLELLARTPYGEPRPPALPRRRRSGGSFYGADLDEAFDFEESLRKALGFARDFESHWEERPEQSVLPGRAVLRARFINGETPVALVVEITPESSLARNTIPSRARCDMRSMSSPGCDRLRLRSPSCGGDLGRRGLPPSPAADFSFAPRA